MTLRELTMHDLKLTRNEIGGVNETPVAENGPSQELRDMNKSALELPSADEMDDNPRSGEGFGRDEIRTTESLRNAPLEKSSELDTLYENEENATSDFLQMSDGVEADEDEPYRASQNELADDEATKSLDECLDSFEQKTWDDLPIEGKKKAISELGSSISDDLRLRDKPKIDYYYNADNNEFGKYDPDTNTIFINGFNLDDAAETADTVAHESRHAWQYERSKNPVTERDYKFKEELADPIDPKDDFRGYINQTVEIDARNYALKIRNLIRQY